MVAAVKRMFERRDPAKLKNHLANIKIYGGRGPSQEFIDSCKDGIHTPLLILPDDTIISGHSRKVGANFWKLKDVPVIVCFDLADDPLEAERILILCNAQREKSGEQLAKEAARLLEIETAIAERRQAANLKRGPVRENVPSRENIEENANSGKAADAVGKALGVSGKTAAKLAEAGRAITEAEASGDEEKAEKIRKAVNRSASAGQRAAREPKNADAVRRNGNLTVKAPQIDEKEVVKAFGAVVRLIDTQAAACGLNNSPGHREATSTLNKALEAYQSFTTDCRSVLARK